MSQIMATDPCSDATMSALAPFRFRHNGHPHTNHFRHLGVRDVVRDDFGKFWKVPGIPFLDAWARWNDP